jgi:hypothetical protein
VVPHRDATDTEHGFVSMAPWDGGALGLLWLDGRDTARAGPTALAHTTLTPDGRLGPETIVDARVCDCCQTDVTQADGALVVVYRDRSPDEVRDIAVRRFTGGRWTEPHTLAGDGWQIQGCPVNGPSVAALGRSVAVAWFTAAQETPRVKVAFSSDSAGSFGAPVVVDGGRPLGQVDVVLSGPDTALVSWLEQRPGGSSLMLREVRRDGRRGEPLTVAEAGPARSSGFPRMVAVAGEVVLAWRDAGEPPRVRTALVDGRR